ncbi:MAG: DUF2786 domain-containing protein [Actinomycetales bacterium]
MGQNSRQRRASKVKRRQQKRAAGRPPFGGPPPGTGFAAGTDGGFDAWLEDVGKEFGEESVDGFGSSPHAAPPPPVTDALVEQALQTYLTTAGDPSRDHLAQDAVALLASPGMRARVTVARVTSQALRSEVAACWLRGWLPLDLSRLLSAAPDHRLAAVARDVLYDAMADEIGTHAEVTVDRRYLDQLAGLGARRWWAPDQPALLARAERVPPAHGADGWETTLLAALDVLFNLHHGGTLPLIAAVPGQASPVRGGHGEVDERILERVRNLLAKAESTTFEAEAETFTAGAQSLMARHRIDAAMLAATAPGVQDGVRCARIYVDAPYEGPKVQLLTAIADVNSCRSIWSKQLGFVSVVGFPGELVAVETLFTSLLVQATSAMHRHGSRQDQFGRSRTRAFRSTFLASFGVRIGERLATVTQEEVQRAQDAAPGGNLLPVLAARDEQVGATFGELFPRAMYKRTRLGTDAEGWHAGRRAADTAALEYGAPLMR